MPLNVQPVHQSEGAKLILGKLAGEESLCLIPELSSTLVYQGLVVMIVLVHMGKFCGLKRPTGEGGKYTTNCLCSKTHIANQLPSIWFSLADLRTLS